ncbi:DegT/DnrJ/EryC1/StrS family aminotransferase [Clostridium cibarium]|uniref:DegT/DnrJ/EryC1/StrS family aminotransferase n=1 Tax=Clostridium cibarium TaxID=2762247 RepID=A0ABR8PXJ9_9CLOT|nr:DegT/DnrJ/EryC1/StrS family aminotransferase [Clostridium cibarium]MBD7912889.1 DegT/DnrJ/EryC1/StrS family aminotransferase [Clostridium cibarium]
MKKIPFAVPEITDDDISEVVKTLKSGWISKGPRVLEFEEKIASFLGVDEKSVIACNSGTAALHLAVLSLGLSEDDEVIVPSFTFCSTANVIEHVGAKPVFVDIDENDYCLDVKKIEEKINEKTKAIIVVHFGGNVGNLNALKDICKKHNIVLIEDAAHAFTSKYDGKYIGNHGDFICFSFYATKNITTGEGGVLIAKDLDHAKKARELCWHGIDKNSWDRYVYPGNWGYSVLDHGYKYNMTDIQAALGISQLKRAEKMKEARRKLFKMYLKELGSLKDYISLPVLDHDNIENSCHLFPIRIKKNAPIDRDEFIEDMKELGVCLSVHYIPVHMHPYYKKYGAVLPKTEEVFNEILSLPLCSSLAEEDLMYVVDCIKKVLKVK